MSEREGPQNGQVFDIHKWVIILNGVRNRFDLKFIEQKKLISTTLYFEFIYFIDFDMATFFRRKSQNSVSGITIDQLSHKNRCLSKVFDIILKNRICRIYNPIFNKKDLFI